MGTGFLQLWALASGGVNKNWWPSLIAGLDCGLDRWTGLLDWIAGSNQTASKGDDACVAHGAASKAEV